MFWNNGKSNLRNQLEYSASCSYEINELCTPALGFHYTHRKYEENSFNINSMNDALFIIAGLKIMYSSFFADISVADSQLFSGKFRKQTIGKIGLGVLL